MLKSARIFNFIVKNQILTIKPAFVIQMINDSVFDSSICLAVAETDTQSTIFDLSALKNQLLIFFILTMLTRGAGSGRKVPSYLSAGALICATVRLSGI